MPERQPRSADPVTNQFDDGVMRTVDCAALLAWADARDGLAADWPYWWATTRPDGRPHVGPVLAVWRNLAANRQCATTFGLTPDVVLAIGTNEAYATRSARWRF
jgi:hypothetical protein